MMGNSVFWGRDFREFWISVDVCDMLGNIVFERLFFVFVLRYFFRF